MITAFLIDKFVTLTTCFKANNTKRHMGHACIHSDVITDPVETIVYYFLKLSDKWVN